MPDKTIPSNNKETGQLILRYLHLEDALHASEPSAERTALSGKLQEIFARLVPTFEKSVRKNLEALINPEVLQITDEQFPPGKINELANRQALDLIDAVAHGQTHDGPGKWRRAHAKELAIAPQRTATMAL